MAINSIILAISEAGVVGGLYPLQKAAISAVQRATVCQEAALTCIMGICMQHEYRHAT
jgi:hypothetical protein